MQLQPLKPFCCDEYATVKSDVANLCVTSTARDYKMHVNQNPSHALGGRSYHERDLLELVVRRLKKTNARGGRSDQ